GLLTATGGLGPLPGSSCMKSLSTVCSRRRRTYPLGGRPARGSRDGLTDQPIPVRIEGYPPSHALCRRNTGGRTRPEPRRPMILLALGLNGLVVCALLFVGCGLMPAGAALGALRAQSWLADHTIEMPRSGPLDSTLPQTARITARDGTLLAE